jgi:hypothetical protein
VESFQILCFQRAAHGTRMSMLTMRQRGVGARLIETLSSAAAGS